MHLVCKVIVGNSNNNIGQGHPRIHLDLPQPLQAKPKLESKFQNKEKIISSIGCSVIKELIRQIWSYITNSFLLITGRRVYDQNRILSVQKKVESAQSAWLLNLALMQDALQVKGLSPEQTKQIQFLCTNYLHKSAPIHLKTMRYFFQKTELMFQVSGLHTEKDYYHRFSLARQINLGAKINEGLAMGNKSPLISTDTIEFQHLLPLKFQVINSSTPSSSDLINSLNQHFSSSNPIKALDHHLLTPFIFDITDYFKDDIVTDGKKEKEYLFQRKYDLFKNKIDKAVEDVVNRLIKDRPELSKERNKLKKFIKNHLTCICRIQTKTATGMKVLPLYSDISKTKVLKVHHDLSEFVVASGIGIGAVSLRQKLIDGLSLRQDVRYEGPAAKAGVKYFSNKADFTNLAIYQRLATSFESQSEPFQYEGIKAINQSVQIDKIKDRLKDKPHIQLLGKATMDLLTGLLKSISPEKWDELHSNEAYIQILQASLYKIREHLATAELHLDSFAEFAQQMELISAEIAILLEITKPFTDDDFAAIFKTSLFSKEPMSSLLPTMQAQFQMRLSKTSVNTFAGINAAILQMNPNPTRVYSPGFYFEQAGFMGYDRSFESVMNNSQTKKIDLYCGQFNSNIEIDKEFTHYQRRDIAKDVREMLDKGKAAKHLTIAIDCTIDNYNSDSVKTILEKFKDEIDSGQLNFIFFRSGQKMDMLGMDNYYGSPFYVVNNGADQWKPFTSLIKHPVHKTDSLSMQWFSLSNKFIPDSLEEYRNLIFNNTRTILDNVPEKLKPGALTSKTLRVNTAATDMKAAFIDIKVLGLGHKLRSTIIIAKFYQKMLLKGIKLQTRATFGLYHWGVTNWSKPHNFLL